MNDLTEAFREYSAVEVKQPTDFVIICKLCGDFAKEYIGVHITNTTTKVSVVTTCTNVECKQQKIIERTIK